MTSNEKIYFLEWRRKSGLSQEALAERMGYSRSSIAKVETMTYNVTLSFLEAFRDAVGAGNIAALFRPPGEADEMLSKLVGFFDGIPNSSGRQTVIDVARGLSERKQQFYEPD